MLNKRLCIIQAPVINEKTNYILKKTRRFYVCTQLTTNINKT